MPAIQKNGVIKNCSFLENSLTSSTYTITGTLTNDNGVFSDFSAANYITTNASIGPFSDKFEIHGSCVTGSDVTTEQYVFCTSVRGISIKVVSSRFYLSEAPNGNNGGWTNAIGSAAGTVIANTKYYFDVISDNTKWYFYSNGILLATLTVVTGSATTSTFGFGNHLPTKVSPFTGQIDLKDWTVEIAGETVWSGVDAYLQNSKAKIGKNFASSNIFYEI